MLQACSCTPNTKTETQNPPFIKAMQNMQNESFLASESNKNNYTRYSEISQSGQNSFFTPGSNNPKKGMVLDDITNLLNNVHPKKLDFSAGLDTASSRGQTPNYIIKKFENETPVQMEIEETNPFETPLDSEKREESTDFGSTMMDGFIQSADNWKRGKGKITNLLGNPNDYSKPKPKNPSLIKRWKKNDKIFQGKYSTGATPKCTPKHTSIFHSASMSLIPFKRCNTDVPPTFEADKLLMIGEQSEIGANKYINNLLGATDGSRQRGLSFKGPTTLSHKAIQAKAFSANMKPKRLGNKIQLLAKPKLLRDFPLDLTQNNNLVQSLNGKSESGLFLIPEKTLECDLLSFFPDESKGGNLEAETRDSVSKLLTFAEDDEAIGQNEDSDQIGDIENIRPICRDQMSESSNKHSSSQSQNCMSPEQKKDFNTPTKRNSPLTEIKFNFFNTVTAKKEAQSKLFIKGGSDSDEIRPFDSLTNKGSYDDNMSENEEPGQVNHSRFDLDYEVMEVLGSGYFGTVYKCQNRLDGLIYAIKCTKNKLKGQNNISQALNEAQALASLSVLDENPFIVRYYSAWIEDDRLYLAMEHCQSNLKTLRHQHIRFSESMIRQIMRDICMGLRHLHNQKIVHLDIKPENILYSKTKKYKIADLGLSRIAQRSNNEDINEGDCRYLAPELLKDYPDTQLPDLTKADIFSFGAAIYELVIGTDLPKNGQEWSSLRHGNLLKLDQLNYSNSLKSMLRSMMDNNPDNRPSAHELLTNYLQSEIELELKWEKKQNKILKEKVKELEEKLRSKRKNSF